MNLFMVSWALVAMPVLCAGGVLVHPCDCGHADECGHEAECESDPCGLVVVRPNDGQDATCELGGSQPTVAPALILEPRMLTPLVWTSPPLDGAPASPLHCLSTVILRI